MGTVRTIGRLAKEAGVTVETIRYYERRGLIDQPRHTDGPRHYGDTTLAMLKYIRTAQGFGLTLREIKSLKGELNSGKDFCGSFRTLVEAKLEEIARKEAELEVLKRNLTQIFNRCRVRPKNSPCPVVEELTNESSNPHSLENRTHST